MISHSPCHLRKSILTPNRDFLLVVKDVYTGPKLRDDDKFLNATIFPVTKFKEMIADHHFLALYCIFLPNEFKWKETITSKLDANVLWRLHFI